MTTSHASSCSSSSSSRQFALGSLCLGLVATASAFSPSTPIATATLSHCRTASPSCPQHRNLHVRHVGLDKWSLPFVNQEEEERITKAGEHSNTADVHNKLQEFFPSFFPQDTAEATNQAMGDLVQSMEEDSLVEGKKEELNNLVPVLGVMAAALVAVGVSVGGVSPSADLTGMVSSFFQDPTASLEHVTDLVASMGPAGPLYFGLMYTIAEVLAIPAVPLTASAGYLFGVGTGTLVVLISASIAASISFVIGRTLLRTTVEGMMEENPKFSKLDKAIGREGFKLMLLLRLSPLFPFALSNYLYGATSIDFGSFFWGTLLGFAPGTLAYVYTGVVGKALTIGGSDAQPWYVYAGGAVVLAGFLKVLVDVASGIVAEIEADSEGSES